MPGGDKRIMELLKNWNGSKKLPYTYTVYGPSAFRDMLLDNGVSGFEYRVTAESCSESGSLIAAYVKRTSKSLGMIPYFIGKQIFYSTSDFFPNVIPCLVGKALNRKAKWVVLVHHIIENYRERSGNRMKNIIAYYEQKASLLMIQTGSSRLLVVSPLVEEYLKQTAGKLLHRKIQRVDNGVDTGYIDGIEPFKDRQKRYDAVMLARMVHSKGIFNLPRIWQCVVNKRPSARLAVIGSVSVQIREEFTVAERCRPT